jgi:hypothetical protein
MVHDDVEILKDSLLDGGSFVGKVIKVGSKLVGNSEKPIWTIQLSPRSSRLYKRRDGESLSVFSLPKKALKVEKFEKVDESWLVTVSWDTGSPLSLQGFSSVPSDERWVGITHSFVPIYSDVFYIKSQVALRKARDGHFASLFSPAEANEVTNVVD